MVATGNTPINLAISNLASMALVVLVMNTQALNLDSVEVSSLWRNQVDSPHYSGGGIDIVAVRRGEVMVYFNNSTAGQQSQAAMALRNEVYNSMVNDPRVSQALDPWWLRSKVTGNNYNEPNTWQNVYDTYLVPQDISLSQYDDASRQQQLQWVGNVGLRRNMLLHRHHLHITIW